MLCQQSLSSSHGLSSFASRQKNQHISTRQKGICKRRLCVAQEGKHQHFFCTLPQRLPCSGDFSSLESRPVMCMKQRQLHGPIACKISFASSTVTILSPSQCCRKITLPSDLLPSLPVPLLLYYHRTPCIQPIFHSMVGRHHGVGVWRFWALPCSTRCSTGDRGLLTEGT